MLGDKHGILGPHGLADLEPLIRIQFVGLYVFTSAGVRGFVLPVKVTMSK